MTNRSQLAQGVLRSLTTLLPVALLVLHAYPVFAGSKILTTAPTDAILPPGGAECVCANADLSKTATVTIDKVSFGGVVTNLVPAGPVAPGNGCPPAVFGWAAGDHCRFTLSGVAPKNFRGGMSYTNAATPVMTFIRAY